MKKGTFVQGQTYTRMYISKALGGNPVGYLPSKDRKVTALCLKKHLNPGAPDIILVGKGKQIISSANFLQQQKDPIPAFIKKDSNQWEYVGDYIYQETITKDEARFKEIDVGPRPVSAVHFALVMKKKSTTRNPAWHRDEIILALDLYFDKRLGAIDASNPKIIALSKLLNKLQVVETKANEKTFRNPNGVSLKLSNFKALDPEYKGKGMSSYSNLDAELFNEFVNKKEVLHSLAEEIKKIASDPGLIRSVSEIEEDENTDVDSVKEGKILYKMHKYRERDKSIIKAKKDKVLKQKGELRCEVCDLNFVERYGEIGNGFIECHHLIPLAKIKTDQETRLEDLALLCANCHRMIHKVMGTETISEFKKRLK